MGEQEEEVYKDECQQVYTLSGQVWDVPFWLFSPHKLYL